VLYISDTQAVQNSVSTPNGEVQRVRERQLPKRENCASRTPLQRLVRPLPVILRSSLSSLSPLFLWLFGCPSPQAFCSCSLLALPAAAALLAGVLLFICASPSTALARAGRLLPRQLYRSAAIQSKLSHRLRVVGPLHNSGIGRNQPLDVPAILYLISLVHWQTSRSAA